jgi:hypothetical protein
MMATLLENLITRRDAIGVELAALTGSAAGGKPNAAGPNVIDHVGYKDGLYRELAAINKLIEEIGGDVTDGLGGPIEVSTEAYV